MSGLGNGFGGIEFAPVTTNVPGSEMYSTSSDAPSSGGSGFWDGTNFMGLLSTLGASIPQVIQATKGQQVIVQGSNGVSQDISADLISSLQAEAASNNTSQSELIKVLETYMSAQNTPAGLPTEKDNTALYVGLGVGGLVLLVGGYLITKK